MDETQESAETALVVALGEEIQLLRRRQRIKREDLAEAAGISFTTMGRVERGDASIDVTTSWKIASALGIEFAELVRLAEQRAARMAQFRQRLHGVQLQRAMDLYGLSRQTIADALSVPVSTVAGWLDGTEVPDADAKALLLKIMPAYDVVEHSPPAGQAEPPADGTVVDAG